MKNVEYFQKYSKYEYLYTVHPNTMEVARTDVKNVIQFFLYIQYKALSPTNIIYATQYEYMKPTMFQHRKLIEKIQITAGFVIRKVSVFEDYLVF